MNINHTAVGALMAISAITVDDVYLRQMGSCAQAMANVRMEGLVMGLAFAMKAGQAPTVPHAS